MFSTEENTHLKENKNARTWQVDEFFKKAVKNVEFTVFTMSLQLITLDQ